MELKNSREFNGSMTCSRTIFYREVMDFDSDLIAKEHKFNYFPKGLETLKGMSTSR